MSDIKKLTDYQLDNETTEQTAIMQDLINGLMGCKTSTDDFQMDGNGLFYTWQKLHKLHEELQNRYRELKREVHHHPPIDSNI